MEISLHYNENVLRENPDLPPVMNWDRQDLYLWRVYGYLPKSRFPYAREWGIVWIDLKDNGIFITFIDPANLDSICKHNDGISPDKINRKTTNDKAMTGAIRSYYKDGGVVDVCGARQFKVGLYQMFPMAKCVIENERLPTKEQQLPEPPKRGPAMSMSM
jgi:hypothetical protein